MKLIKGISIAVVGLMIVACNGKNKANGKEVVDQTPNVPTVRTEGLKLAFYNQDSLTKHFMYYVEMDSLMKRKQLSFQKEYQRREAAFYKFAGDYDAKAKAGSLSAFELQSAQQEIERKQQALMQYQQEEGGRLEKETVELLNVITKKIEGAGRDYSKKHGIDILMTQGTGSQFVYINEAMDVSNAFIAYLNDHQAQIEADLGNKTKK